MAIYSTAFKSGTITGVSGTTITVSGFTPASSDVGRLIIITSGTARLQHREITAVSGSTLTIAHTWNTNPFIDPTSDQRASDITPANGSSCVISYDVSDLISTDAELSLSGSNQLRLSGNLEVYNGAYIHFKGYNFDFASDSIQIGEGGGLIFGYYNYVAGEDGYLKDSCTLFDRSSTGAGGNQMARGATLGIDFGMLDIYGGNLRLDPGGGFWRCYQSSLDSRDCQCRWINLKIDGSFGSRVDGDRSLILVENVNSTSTTGIANPRQAVARVEFTAFNCDQAGYVFLSQGPSGRAVFPRLADINTRILRVADTGGFGEVYEVVAKKSEVDQVPLFAVVESNAPLHTIRYGNLVSPLYINPNLSNVTETVVTRLLDRNGTIVNSQTLTDGQYPEFFARHTDIASSSGNKTLASGTLFAPYSLRAISYGKSFTTSSIDAEDTFNFSVTLLDDPLITEQTQATVDAYTEIETPQKFYDRAVSWLSANITDESEFLVTRTGSQIDLGSRDLTIDASAGSAFAVDGSGNITIKASTFTGSLTTTGTVTLLNGASVAGTITDTNGSRFAYTLELPNIIDDSRYQVYNVTTDTTLANAVVSGGSGISETFAAGTDFTGGDEGQIRITYQNGTTCKQPIELGFTFSSEAATNSLPNAQADDEVYAAYGVDGSTITEFTWDSGNIQIDINDADNTTVIQRIAAWMCYFTTTSTGIDEAFGSLDWESLNSIKINTSVVDLKLDNTKATPLLLNGGRIYRDDGTTIIAAISNTIQIDYTPVYIAETGVSGLTASESTQLFALGTPGAVADAVWDEAIADHTTSGTTGEALSNAGGGSSPSAIADAVWDEARSGHVTAGTFGEVLDATISSRASQTSVNNLNDLSAADVNAEIDTALADYDGPTKAELDTAQTAITDAISALNDLSAAEVNAEVDQALSDYDAPTKSELDAAQTAITNAISALNNLSAAQVNAEVDSALADYDGPTKAELDAAQAAIESAISGLNDPTAAAVAAAVWTYLQSESTVSGSMKEAVELILTRSGLIPASV
jgi:hypothetical protein